MSRDVYGLTPDYRRIVSSSQLTGRYGDCLAELISEITSHNPGNLETILLYGGIVRDVRVFDGWSDIDVIVIFRDISKRSARDLAGLIHVLEDKYSIRIDLTQVSLREVTDRRLAGLNTNSELINALSVRDNVSTVIYGRLPKLDFTPEQEKQAAVFYITNTLALFRRYLVEIAYRGNRHEYAREDLKRTSRWMFSIIRASLRLFGVYSHPYQYSLGHLERLFPELDTSLPKHLVEMRRSFNKVDIPADMIHRIETFVEDYVVLSLEKYSDEVERNA